MQGFFYRACVGHRGMKLHSHIRSLDAKPLLKQWKCLTECLLFCTLLQVWIEMDILQGAFDDCCRILTTGVRIDAFLGNNGCDILVEIVILQLSFLF